MSDTHIQLIVGLGNPGSKYERTRHNAGFWLVDELAKSLGGSFQNEAKFFGQVCRLSVGDQEVRLLKPDTFMNESGRSVQAISRFFKIPPEQILIAYDEIDLPPGKIKLKKGGGHGGHNGVRDVMAQLGGEFLRLRIGVGHPGDKSQVVNYVLGVPSLDDEIDIVRSVEAAVGVVPVLISDGLQKATHQLHSNKAASDETSDKELRRKPSAQPVAKKKPETPAQVKKKTHYNNRPVKRASSDAADKSGSDAPAEAESVSLKDQLLALFKKR